MRKTDRKSPTLKPKTAYQNIVEKTLRANIPFAVLWELTYKCNLNCVHCYRIEDRRRKELTTEQGKSLLRQLAEEGTLNLTLTGGEPLTRPDFFELAAYAKELNFAIRIFSNGTLISKKTAEQISSLYPTSIHISLYAADKSLFEQVTRLKGSYEKAINAIDILREKDIGVVLKVPLMNLNHSQYHLLKKLAVERGCDILFDTKITPQNDGSPGPTCYQMDESTLYDIIQEYLD